MEIDPVLSPSQIAAVVFNSALLDMARLASTGLWATDYLFLQCGRAYMRIGFPTGRDIRQADVIAHATDQFPPAFISDRNFGTFETQAFDLAARLDGLGVTNELVYFSPEVAKLFHGFEVGDTPQATESLARQLSFMNRALATRS